MKKKPFYKTAFEKYKHFMLSAQQFLLLHIVFIIGIGLTAVVAKLVRKHFLQTSHTHSSWIPVTQQKDSSKMF